MEIGIIAIEAVLVGGTRVGRAVRVIVALGVAVWVGVTGTTVGVAVGVPVTVGVRVGDSLGEASIRATKAFPPAPASFG